jgi:two-component system, cell cycle sensor histidine kinase PleC
MFPGLDFDAGLTTVIEAVEAVSPDAPSRLVYDRLRSRPNLVAIPVVAGTEPVGLIDRNHLTMSLAHRYGNALYADKPVTLLMDSRPLIVDHAMPIESLERTIADENPSALMRGFIVTRDGDYIGMASALSLLRLSMARTERRNRELDAARKSAEAASQAKSQFLSVVSHELRTPLNAIIGFSDVMKTGLFGTIEQPRYREYLHDISNAANSLLGVINDVLDMAKIEQGKMELYEEPLDLKELCLAAVRLLSERAAAAGLAFHASLPPAPALLLADRRAVRHMLTNLLANAIKFTPAGGRVSVAVRPLADGGLELAIADTGIGMSPDHVKIAVTPFGQVENAHTRKYEGTGLGLPIVKSLAELHGASFEIESALNVGTTVRIGFPSRRVLEWGLTGDPVWPEELVDAI